MDSNSLVFQQQTTSLSLSVSKCTTPALKLTRRLKSKKLFTDWWVWSLFDQLNLDLFNVCRLCIKSVGGVSANYAQEGKRSLAYSEQLFFNSKSPHSGHSRQSHMDQECMKFPAALFSNYCHRCLPLNWPRLSQHALLVSVSHSNCCLQLHSKPGAWLSYTTPGELPLSWSISPFVPSGWRKMYSPLGRHRHLNSNCSSFLLRPLRVGWPHDGEARSWFNQWRGK